MEHMQDSAIRYIWLRGGSSASKTYTYCQAQIRLMLESSDENALVMRKFGSDIFDSIYADFKGLISKWKLNDEFIIQQNYIECIATGSFIRFRGLDDPEKVKGISQFKRVVLEEVTQFNFEDLKQVRKRLRGRRGQQIMCLFNPIHEDHWVKKNVFDVMDLRPVDLFAEAENLGFKYEDWKLTGKWINDKGNAVIIKTTYLDNKYIVGPHFVDQHTIDDFEQDRLTDPNYYRIYGLGDWGKLRTGGEFWKDFNSSRDVFDLEWDEALPLHITWDENVNPYLTLLIWQGSGLDLCQVDEICLEDPRNRVYDTCLEFIKRYPPEKVKGLFVYGDRTSMKQDTKIEKGENFYTKILEYLKAYHPRLRMPSVNPSVVQSAGFINDCYAGRVEGVRIRIASRCTKSIHDYQYALEDSDGTLKKTKKIHPVTKVSYEEFGHPSDAKRYFLTMYLMDQYARYRKGGRKSQILTGGGSKNNF